MRHVVFIPHFYQPPTQAPGLTEFILHSCYLPIFDNLLKNPEAQMSLNITGSLLLQIKALGNNEFFTKLKTLLSRSQIELLNSPAYHPLLPIIPRDAALRQLAENKKITSALTGFSPVAGVLPPELALDNRVLKLLSGVCEFTVVDQTNLDSLSPVQINGLSILVNNHQVTEIIRSYPHELSVEKFTHFLGKLPGDLLVSVTDAEVFGHHYSERSQFFADLVQSKEFKFIKATTALKQFPAQKVPEKKFSAGSWQDGGFSLWTNSSLQKQYLALAKEAYLRVRKSCHTVATEHFDKGLSSCFLYWLSNHPWWHPDLVESGANNLVRAVRSLELPHKEKRRAEKLYHELISQIWHYHWSGKVEKNYARYQNERRTFLQTLSVL